jgi:hypothetical protein
MNFKFTSQRFFVHILHSIGDDNAVCQLEAVYFYEQTISATGTTILCNK